MKRQLSLNDVDKLVKNDDWEYTIKRTSKHHVVVNLLKVYRKCFICGKKLHIDSMVVRQDERVTGLRLPKKLCRKDAKDVDYLITMLK
tara:strand:- start:195 stop:458 length:264 start_codon:yes stop_codon:yes gene_type:complete